MTKRIYNPAVKKWAVGTGVTAVPIAILLIWYLSSLGSITVTGFSGDQICSGTIEDPCIVLANFTANEDIFIYPSSNWSSMANTSISVKDVKMYRSWGNGWREINLTTNCKGTWCGASDNKGNTAYSFAFRKDREYQIKFVILKNNPGDKVTWSSFGANSSLYGLTEESLEKEYNSSLQEISMVSKTDDNIALKFRLQSSINEYVIRGKDRKVAEYTITNYYGEYPISSIIGPVEFIDVDTNEKIDREYHYEVFSFDRYENIPIYELRCDKLILGNGTEINTNCRRDFVEFRKVERYEWKELNMSGIMGKGNMTIALVTDVMPNENVEWIPTFNGIKSPEWAGWTDSLAVGLKDYWNFEEGTGSVAKGSLNKYNLTIWNSSAWVTGKVGSYALNFSAASKQVANTTGNITISTTNLTVNGWVKLNTVGKKYAAVLKVGHNFNTGGGTSANLQSELDDLAADTWLVNVPNTDVLYDGSSSADVGTWIMITVMYNVNTNNLTLYRNAELVGSAGLDNDLEQGEFWLAYGTQGHYGVFVADEFSVHNRSLSDEELTQFYNDGDGITYLSGSITLNYPVDNQNISNNIVNFSVIPACGSSTCNVSLYGNWTGWHINATNTSALSGNQTNFSISGIPDGKHIYGGSFTTDGEITFSESNYTFTKDTVNPLISYNPTSNSSGYYNNDWIIVNVSTTDVNTHSVRLSWNGTNETFASNSNGNYWSNKSGLSDGPYIIYGWINDTVNHRNFTEVRNITIDTTVPLISFSDPTLPNASIRNQDWIYLNVSITELNFMNLTYNIYYLNNTLMTSVVFTNTTRNVNITGLSNDLYKYNATVFDAVNNSNSTETREISLISNISIYFGSFLGNSSAEIANTSIKVNGTGNVTICLDLDSVEYGNNYLCSSGETVYINPNFTKSLFLNGSSSQTFNYSSLTAKNITISSHKYDEPISLQFNISGVNNPNATAIFFINSTPDVTNITQYVPLIDRWYEGVLNGSVIYLPSIYGGDSQKNLSYSTGSNSTIYFVLDDILDTRTIYGFILNITGFPLGMEYKEGNHTPSTSIGFNSYTNISVMESDCQLDSSGIIMPKNVTKTNYYYDDFGDGILNQTKWVNGSCSSSGSDYVCAYESGGNAIIATRIGTEYALVEENLRSRILLNPIESDTVNISFDAVFISENSAGEDGDAVLYVFWGGGTVWDVSTYDNQDDAVDEQTRTHIVAKLTKVNRTTWKGEYWGYENKTTVPNVNTSNTKYSGYLKYFDVTNISKGLQGNVITLIDTGTPLTMANLTFAEVNHTLWTRSNSTVVSNSIYDTGGNIESAIPTVYGKSVTGESTYLFLSADNGENWESAATGVSHTFSNQGSHLRWALTMNITGTDDYNSTQQLWGVNISIPKGNASNITLDWGDDGIIDYTFSEEFGQANGTQLVNLSNKDISSAFNSNNRISKTSTTYYDHTYNIPLKIGSDSRGLIVIDAINLTYNPNPIVINVSKNLSNVLGNSTGNNSAFRIPIASWNQTGSQIRIDINSLIYKYIGGNWVLNVTAHDTNYTVNKTNNITFYHSRWDYIFGSSLIQYLEFIPKSPTSKNVTPFGQSNITPILNITNYGYTPLTNATLSVYMNETTSCVNISIGLNNTKSQSIPLNNSWVNLTTLQFLQTQQLWMWADYQCSYNNWTLFNPSLYFRQCAIGVQNCSESI